MFLQIYQIIKPKIPKNQVLWRTFTENNIPYMVITSSLLRDKYFLYEVEHNNNTCILTKIETATTPNKFKNLEERKYV